MSRFLSKIAEEINICEFTDYKDFFRTVYTAAKKEKSNYTYITFTEELGLGQSNLMNLVVNGQRRLSRKNALIIIKSLSLVLEKRRYLLRLVELDNSRNMQKREKIVSKIIDIKSEALADDHSRDQLKFYSHWLHALVFEIIGLTNSPTTPESIAEMLIPHAAADEVARSLQLLESLGLIEKINDGAAFQKIQSHFIMNENLKGVGPLAFHSKMIELAKDAMVRIHEDERDISSITLAMPEQGITMLKKLVEDFQEKILELAEKYSNSDTVYQVNFQVFPLTKKIKRTLNK
ncbi:MAG: hypothetical protein RJB13_190 [Pseudomonadota bacterium]